MSKDREFTGGATDRRRTRRVSSSFRCWIRGPSCAVYAPIHNINRDGLSVVGRTPFREGDEVSIRIEGEARSGDLVARSRVVWHRDEGVPEQEIGMGAEFLEITAGEQLLERILGFAVPAEPDKPST